MDQPVSQQCIHSLSVTTVMPYIELGLTDTQYVPSQDDGTSSPIYVDFPFGGQIEPVIYVCNIHYITTVLCIRLQWYSVQVGTNGYFTFDGFTGYSPFLFNENSSVSLVAPFFTDIDISSGIGEISYEVHNGTVSEPVLTSVDSLINEYMQTDFHGEWLLVAKWDNVPHISDGFNVGVLYLAGESYFYYCPLYISPDKHISGDINNRLFPIVCCVHI